MLVGWLLGFGPLESGIVRLNPAQGMDVFSHLSVLCCPEEVQALRRTDPPSTESYQMSN
jgi:hypothetical protein